MESFYIVLPFIVIAMVLLSRLAFQLHKIERKINQMQNIATDGAATVSAQLQSLKGKYCWFTVYNSQDMFSNYQKYYCKVINCDETFVLINYSHRKMQYDIMVRVGDIVRIHIPPQ